LILCNRVSNLVHERISTQPTLYMRPSSPWRPKKTVIYPMKASTDVVHAPLIKRAAIVSPIALSPRIVHGHRQALASSLGVLRHCKLVRHPEISTFVLNIFSSRLTARVRAVLSTTSFLSDNLLLRTHTTKTMCVFNPTQRRTTSFPRTKLIIKCAIRCRYSIH